MARFLLILCTITFLFSGFCFAKPLVADISDRSVLIDSNFIGTDLLLFGARNDPGEIVVTIRGPAGNYVVRKKERIAGIWVNRKQVYFKDVDGFYSIASSRPLAEFKNQHLLDSLSIGLPQLQSSLKNKVSKNLKANQDGAFSSALLSFKQRQHLYANTVNDVDFIGETLFRTVINIPDNIPRGTYLADIYLLNDGQLSGIQTTPIVVEKTGFDAFMYDFAYNHSFLYGITAIILALGAGWFAGIIFKKV